MAVRMMRHRHCTMSKYEGKLISDVRPPHEAALKFDVLLSDWNATERERVGRVDVRKPTRLIKLPPHDASI